MWMGSMLQCTEREWRYGIFKGSMNPLRLLHQLLVLVIVPLAALFSSLAWTQTATPAGAPAVLPDTMAQRMLACTVCHGREGRATSSGYFPRIAGKPAGYLYNQLTHFREGRRQNAAMAALLHTLSDDYLRDIAQHFAALDLPYPPPQRHTASDAVLKRGEALVRQGDPQRNIPACAACHGSAMTGVSPAMPGLLGLPRDYLLGQLGAWQTGLRHAAEPDCMARVAKALSVDDVSAVATWLASQPLPANTKPAATIARPLPLRCGSDQP
jgi:cytochrome c553